MLRMSEQQVLPGWIDNNGHMNVAYYTMAFDLAYDEMLCRHLGMGRAFMERHRVGPFNVQSHYRYLAEQQCGDRFYTCFRIMDYDRNKLHLFAQMHSAEMHRPLACWEGLSINVDLEERRSVPFLPDVYRNIQAAYDITRDDPAPEHAGQPLGIRRPA